MKQFLFFVLACGIFTGISAQSNISDKWVLKENKMKTTTGRVVMTNKTGR